MPSYIRELAEEATALSVAADYYASDGHRLELIGRPHTIQILSDAITAHERIIALHKSDIRVLKGRG